MFSGCVLFPCHSSHTGSGRIVSPKLWKGHCCPNAASPAVPGQGEAQPLPCQCLIVTIQTSKSMLATPNTFPELYQVKKDSGSNKAATQDKNSPMCQNSSVHLLSLTHTRVLPLLIRESQLSETLRWLVYLTRQGEGKKMQQLWTRLVSPCAASPSR